MDPRTRNGSKATPHLAHALNVANSFVSECPILVLQAFQATVFCCTFAPFAPQAFQTYVFCRTGKKETWNMCMDDPRGARRTQDY